MPQKVFIDLDTEKQERIIDAALKEFAEYGYESSSTNRIVKECGISKGSLFKYFENKEELYFYLFDTVSAQMALEMSADLAKMPKDIFERVIFYSVNEMSWYVSNPLKGRFLIGVAAESGSDIRKKIIERYGERSNEIYEELLKGVDMSGLHSSRKEITNILRWVLTGFNSSFLQDEIHIGSDMEIIKKAYIKKLRCYLKILKNGL